MESFAEPVTINKKFYTHYVMEVWYPIRAHRYKTSASNGFSLFYATVKKLYQKADLAVIGLASEP